MRSRLFLVATVLVTACENTTAPLDAAPNESATATTGSIIGVVRGSGTGYPWGTWTNGYPGGGSVWPLSAIIAYPESPNQQHRFPRDGSRIGSFAFDGLPAGRWEIRFYGWHPFSMIFPGMRLYADSTIGVTVEPNRTVDLQDVVPRPVDPFIVVAIDYCPWGLRNPPTLIDWGNCDSGYWGAPVNIQVDVRGVAGTPTSGRHYSFSIPRGQVFYELHDVAPGEYDVSVVPAAAPVAWRLVPWQSSSTRLQLERGISYELFSFWHITP